jgi:hypothetical protein
MGDLGAVTDRAGPVTTPRNRSGAIRRLQELAGCRAVALAKGTEREARGSSASMRKVWSMADGAHRAAADILEA